MIYLLDSDMAIFMMRGVKSRRPVDERQRAVALAERCSGKQAAGHIVAFSAITVSELEFGARRSGNYDVEIAAVRKLIAPFAVFDFDGVHCPLHYGVVRNVLVTKGIVIGVLDMLIAAHALALDATVVTNNVAHFERVPGLKTANWLVAA